MTRPRLPGAIMLELTVGDYWRRGLVMTTRQNHAPRCRVIRPGVPLSYSSPSSTPFRNENLEQGSMLFADPHKDAEGVLGISVSR